MELQTHDHPKGLFDRLVADGYSGRGTVRLRDPHSLKLLDEVR